MTDDVRDFVLKIYDTVADQTLWPSVLDEFAKSIDAYGCIVFEWERQANERRLKASLFSKAFKSDLLNEYLDQFHAYEASDQDRFEACSLASDSIDLLGDDVLAASRAELLEREHVKHLLKYGIGHRAAGLLNKDNTTRSRFSVQLRDNRGALNAEEHARMGALLPHIAKALDLGRPAAQLANEHSSMLTAMDRLSIGVCILDKRCSIVLANEEFKRQLDTYKVFLAAPNGSLRMHRAVDQGRLDALLADALNHGKFGARPRKEAIMIDSSNGHHSLCVEMVPINKSDEMGTSAFGGYILYSLDTSLPVRCDAFPMKHVFGLTETELQLVDSLGQGLTNGQIAERRDRSVATINVQIKSILAKTECSTRTQFVRLMMNFGADYLRHEA